MTTREKLALHGEIDARNDERIRKYTELMGVHKAIEIYAAAIVGSLDILSQHFDLPRTELLDALVATLYAADQQRAQEDMSKMEEEESNG